jgi:hypothetical protein
MKPAAIAAIALAAAFVGALGVIIFYEGLFHQKCDDPASIEIVKQMAMDRLKVYDNFKYLLPWAPSHWGHLMESVLRNGDLELRFSAFRERGKVGKGVTCAALIAVHFSFPAGIGETGTGEMSTEYSVEPTTDGKVMVTARFMPN